MLLDTVHFLDFIRGSLFNELGFAILVAAVLSYVVVKLKQPIIVAYMITGVLIGPALFDIIASNDIFTVFAKIGIVFLLFMVGLNLNIRHIKQIGKVAIFCGVGQIITTFVASYLLTRLTGIAHLPSVYVAIALTFSSTIIVVKLLSDRGDLDKLYGRISVGVLVIQDFVAIFILLLISSEQSMSWQFIGAELAIGIALLLSLYVISQYVFPKLLPSVAKSQELLFIFSLAWCFVMAFLFEIFHFSLEIGALLAGMSLASTPFASQINIRVKPIRDFFILMFFIDLTTHMTFAHMSQILLPAVLLSLFVLFVSPLFVIMIMSWLGFSKKNSFLTGITISQISEFSLIVIILGVTRGILSPEILSLVTLVTLTTILGSTYIFTFSNKIYTVFSKYLGVFERKTLIDKMGNHDDSLDYRIYLFGYNRTGYSVLTALKKLKKPYLIVDHNPDTIVKLAQEGVHCKYGDAEDIEILSEMNVRKLEMVISTIPDFETNLLLISRIREVNKKTIIIITSNHLNEALEMYEHGADYVILPHYISGDHASTIIENFGVDFDKFLKNKIDHIRDLRVKRRMKHGQGVYVKKK